MYEFDDLTMPYSDDAFENVSRLLACRPATESTTSGNATKAEPKSNDVQGKVLTRFNKRKVLSPVELVEILFDAIAYELPALKFEYFEMHTRCWTLLQALT